jgi:predicted phosphoribosyltransferase/tRNA(Ser,Leu) C12 N-acetylase TAN1
VKFRDRADAGRRLGEALASILKPPCVVAGIPRGGVAVALPIVERFRVPLTVVYARKLTAPVAPEFAFGAIDEDGHTIIDAASVAALGLSQADVEQAKERVSKEIRRRMATYGVPPLGHYLPDAAVVLADDGLATGLTMKAALQYARRHGAREIIVAVPCAATASAREFERIADRFVGLLVDRGFMAVGQYYEDFSSVSDAEVIAMLARAREVGERESEPTAAGSTPIDEKSFKDDTQVPKSAPGGPELSEPDFNLLVSTHPFAPGRARREIADRVRSVTDAAPDAIPNLARGIFAIKVPLDPREVVRRLRALCDRRPRAFHYTLKWVPVDRWARAELPAMKAAVAQLRQKIGPNETWRMTFERRTATTGLDPSWLIRSLAELIDAKVDLSHPDKVVLAQLFDKWVAFSIVAPNEVFSVVKRGRLPDGADARGETSA